MSEAPAKIWAYPSSVTGWKSGYCRETPARQAATEYVRADRIEALEAERDKQREHIRAQAEDIMTLGHLVYDDADPPVTWKMRALTAEADKARLSEALRSTLASLVAAVSLLKRGSKKAAPSNKMFDQMILDYEKSIEEARAALSGSGSGWREPNDGHVYSASDLARLLEGRDAFIVENGLWEEFTALLAASPAAPQQGGE